jgi:LmbE family N-acetylglucosaminyl deacetylase
MAKKLLAIFAHPDDEAFGPAGTLAYYAKTGVEIHLLCATRGEARGNRIQNSEFRIQKEREKEDSPTKKSEETGKIRERELLKSAQILGIKKVEFLCFTDGKLCNALYHKLADKIIKKINDFRPLVILTTERRGISGHLDHIAVSMITTYSHLKTKIANKLYYYCLPKSMREKMHDDYFVYFPEGYRQEEITTRIDYSFCWKQKIRSMMAHQSQIKDVKTLLSRYKKREKIDYFILQNYQNVKVKLPEYDLFAGI